MEPFRMSDEVSLGMRVVNLFNRQGPTICKELLFGHTLL